MEIAFAEAKAAAERREVPVGAVLIDGKSGQILAKAGNRTEEWNDPTAHAEILVIREAAKKLGAPRIPHSHLYVTLEPCALCAAAISFARIERLYYAAMDPKGGAVEHGARFFNLQTCHHKPQTFGGLDQQRSADLLQTFFQSKRK